MKKKYLKYLAITAITAFFYGCKSTDVGNTAYRPKGNVNLIELVNSKSYRIQINTAKPLPTAASSQVMNRLMMNTGNTPMRVDVQGQGHYIEVNEEMAKGDLPFFGEQRNSAGRFRGANAGIMFDDTMEEYTEEYNEKKNQILISFVTRDLNQASEEYRVRLTITGKGNTEVSITPTYRTFMRYSGRLIEIKDKTNP